MAQAISDSVLTAITTSAENMKHAGQQRKVAAVDRVVEQPAQAGPAEHDLDHDGAGQHGAELQADDGDRGHDSVAEGVVPQDRAGAERPWRGSPG